MLGELKDEYADILSENSSWYVHGFMAFGPKMYQLVLKDGINGKIVRWNKTMKGISMEGKVDLLSIKSTLDFCSISHHGSEQSYQEFSEIHAMM